MGTQNQIKPIERLKNALSVESVQEQFRNALQENAGPYIASLIDIYNNDKTLQDCEPRAVIMEALKAATLKLPINKSLGFAYLVPYKTKGKAEPQMQIGYRGYIQLAMRTGQYRHINADVVYEGELQKADKLTGAIDLSGDPKSGKIIGYFAYIETINGFSKTLYWTKSEVTAHAERFSKSYTRATSAWQTDFDAMAKKTMLRNLLSHYGYMSVEMAQAIASDTSDDRPIEEVVAEEVAVNANTEVIDIEGEEADEPTPRNSGSKAVAGKVNDKAEEDHDFGDPELPQDPPF